MAKVVLIGVVGGCVDELERAVSGLDAETVVVQVGDLVDRGPDSTGVLALVGPRLGRKPRRWVQLVGNHEWQYLTGVPFWPEPLPDADVGVLQDWWLRERVQVASAVRSAGGEEFLVTHAGLGVEAWRALGEPVTASTAAELLNTRPADVLAGFRGPLWASAGADVYETWLDGDAPPMPFSQIHGHDVVVSYPRRTFLCSERVRQRTTVDWEARHTVTDVRGARFVAIDPKHGKTGTSEWAPFVLDGAAVLV